MEDNKRVNVVDSNTPKMVAVADNGYLVIYMDGKQKMKSIDSAYHRDHLARQGIEIVDYATLNRH